MKLPQGAAQRFNLAFVGELLAFGQFHEFQHFLHLIGRALKRFHDLHHLVDRLVNGGHPMLRIDARHALRQALHPFQQGAGAGAGGNSGAGRGRSGRMGKSARAMRSPRSGRSRTFPAWRNRLARRNGIRINAGGGRWLNRSSGRRIDSFRSGGTFRRSSDSGSSGQGSPGRGPVGLRRPPTPAARRR